MSFGSEISGVYRHYNEITDTELVVVRAYHKGPNGDGLQGQWAVYDFNTGEFLDNSPFRHDLIEKWFN